MSTPSAVDVLGRVQRALAVHPRVVLCQIVRVQGSTPGKLGWKMLVEPDGEAFGNLGGGAFEALVLADARALLAGGRSSRTERYYLTEDAVKGQATGMVCGGMTEVFLEVVSARPVLAIHGGGPVGQALAAQAALCDFEVCVVDDREEFLRPELFPAGVHAVKATGDSSTGALDPWRARDLFVAVVSRCWETDLAAIVGILRQRPPGLRYLGLMGSRRKVARVVDGLRAEGLDLEGIPWHAPVGLALGATTPAEIAVSITAEIIRLRRRGDGEQEASQRAVRMV